MQPVRRELYSRTRCNDARAATGGPLLGYILAAFRVHRIGKGAAVRTPLRIIVVRIVVGQASRRGSVQIRDPDVAGAAALAKRTVGDPSSIGSKARRPRPIRGNLTHHSPSAVHDDE